MAVVLLSGLSSATTTTTTLRYGNDVRCWCRAGGTTDSSASSSSFSTMAATTSMLEASSSTLVRNYAIALPVNDVAAAFPSLRSQSGAVSWRDGGRSSRRKSYGCEIGIGMTSMCRSELRGSRFAASATKDRSRLQQTDSREDSQSSRRTLDDGSGNPNVDAAHQNLETSDNQAVHESPSEQGVVHVTTDSHASTSKGAANDEEDDQLGNKATIGTVVAGLGLVVTLGGFGVAGFLYKDQINGLVNQFTDFIEGYGSAGYVIFTLGYALLELVAIPAIPLTMSAGLLFGVGIGTLVVSLAGLLAATTAFLIARYLARNRLLEYIKDNKKFMAIDKAIGEDGFRVVALLRLSPLLPFSLGNYLYGLTSVELVPYVVGSWVGMLPGTWAYVSAGAIGRSLIAQEESENLFSGRPEHLWTLGLGVAVTALAATYITRVAKDAVRDIEKK